MSPIPRASRSPAKVAASCVAVLASVMPVTALLGYVADVPAWISLHPEHAVTSPLTAVALLLLAGAVILTAQNRDRTARVLSAAACCVALPALLSNLLYGTDQFSPVITRLISSRAFPAGRTSLGTCIGLMSIGAAALPAMRRSRWLSNALCGIAMVLASIAILAYAYGTLDLYATVLFKTMALRTAITLFLLGLSTLIVSSEDGWFALLLTGSPAGVTTRRQLLFALAGPVVGWLALRAYQDVHLGVGASLAIFVTITTVPLIWLIFRDGRLLRDLDRLRRARGAAAEAHTQELERQLTRQSRQLERQSEERIGLITDAKTHSDNRYRLLFQSIDAGFCVIELKFDASERVVDYLFLEVNSAFETLTGLEQAQGRWMRELAPDRGEYGFDLYGEVAISRAPARFESHTQHPEDRWYDVHAFAVDDAALNRVGVLFNDITGQKRATEALRQMNQGLEQRVKDALAQQEHIQEALRQSQKMEAVGQLTGGLAHDFNNLLQGITGSLELLQARVAQGRIEDAGRYVTAAQGAARRASSLTHRLLAFSRRQTLDPKPTDVNRLVTGMEDLIRRTVGPHIRVETIAAGGLWNTLVDQSQLENALLNLCINARDAMPDGGQLVMETGNKWLDERAAHERELSPGQYVTLCVSDNGGGMPPEVMARAFDPFFTTKPLGMGTGLGLSMIYGFAKQSGGQVRIYSEVGAGTMVCMWLPRFGGEVSESETPADSIEKSGSDGEQTVLVVDDEPTVRMLMKDVLDELGYTSIEASEGAGALKVLHSDARIDLLITDVGLPGGMNGRQVADAARVARPGLKILFVTGYAENAVLSHGHLASGMHVLTKPFRMEALAARIKDLVVDGD